MSKPSKASNIVPHAPARKVPRGHRLRTIYLSEDWSDHNPGDISVLVHEIVHHLQASADMRFACPAEREVLAYRAQDAWLRLFGTNLENAFGIDSMMLLVATACTH